MWRLLFRDRRDSLITQRQLEQKIGFPVGSIGAIERGLIRLHPDQEAELDQVLDEIEQKQESREVIAA